MGNSPTLTAFGSSIATGREDSDFARSGRVYLGAPLTGLAILSGFFLPMNRSGSLGEYRIKTSPCLQKPVVGSLDKFRVPQKKPLKTSAAGSPHSLHLRGGGGRGLPPSLSLELMSNLIQVYFDGGSTKRHAYGSWEVVHELYGRKVQWEQYQKWYYENGVRPKCCTNNIAEYLALLGALKHLDLIADKEPHQVEIWGDSLLVVNQLTGRFKARNEKLKQLCLEALTVLEKFPSWSAYWYGRKNNVSRFGH